jgi:phosphate transport system protein
METQIKACIEIARDQLESMAAIVEAAVGKATNALIDGDVTLAHSIIEDDKTINSYEIDIDNSTFNAFALYSRELPEKYIRSILSVQKINPMLERIGDHAVNIAESAESIANAGWNTRLFSIPKMAEQCEEILHDALGSFFQDNKELAEDVLTRDEVVDQFYIAITKSIKEATMSGSNALPFDIAMEMIRVCKNLERVADLASNIAEVAAFSISGESVKHSPPRRFLARV